MNKKTLLAAAVVTALASFSAHGEGAADLTILDYVNPFVGTTNYGTTNPGALVPNGLMSVSPFNVTGSELNRYDKDSRWWSTPYDHTNSYLTGFSHVNLSGVGCPEMGSVITMATTGPLEPDFTKYGSTYTDEAASPGYYTATLSKYGIKAEVTASPRTSVEKFTFPAGQGNILVNLGIGLSNEVGGSITRLSDTEITGSRVLGSFCYNPKAVFVMYFAARVNKKPSSSGYWKKQPLMTGVEAAWTPDNGTYKIYDNTVRSISGDDTGYWFTYDSLAQGEQVELSVAVSFVSESNALANLNAEQSGKNFDSILADARDNWASQLGRIRVWGDEGKKRIFYTALYHSLIHPNILQDVNGQYPGMESGEILTTDRDRYTVFSLWDTYRNLHQLLTLVYPEKQNDMVNSMVEMYREWGWLPKWELFGRETFTMEGDPAIPVIVDTWSKGLKNFDINLAYEAMKKSALSPSASNPMRPDNDPYLAKGYIPLGFYAADNSGDNSVSHALEYYVADNALARLADELGHKEFADSMRKQAKGYRHYYSKETGTLRPLNADGTFLTPFDPRQGENFEPVPGFHEGSAWNYTFFVPHDVDGLISLMGGKKKFVDKLQSVFDLGLYDPSNEPDIAYPYLFSRVKGEEWRTRKEVDRLLETSFKDTPDGLPGNDDTGTMSAWAVFSMMGLYPDCPGEPYYTLTVPAFERVEIDLDPKYYGASELVITRSGEGDLRQVTLGSKPLKDMRVSHDKLIASPTLDFQLGK